MQEAKGLSAQLFKLNSLVVMLLAVGIAAYVLTLPIGSLEQPGAGMWPLAVTIVMGIAALALLITERSAEDYEPLSRRTWIIVAGFALMALFLIGFINIGLTLSSLLLCIVWMRWMAREKWPITIILSVVFTTLFVVLFAILLRVPMPQDILLNLIMGKGL